MRKTPLVVLGLVVAILAALGLFVLSSASVANGTRLHHDANYFVVRQAIYAVAGILIAVVAAYIDYHIYRDHPSLACLAYLIVLVLLALVFEPHIGRKINGSSRWISCVFFNLQPGELAKLVLVIVLAVWFDKAGYRVELFLRGALMPCVLMGALAVLVIVEPDFGSTFVMGLTWMLLAFVAGVRILHILLFASIGGALGAVRVLTNANRMARIKAWFVDDANASVVLDTAAKNAAHQGNMALAAIGRGGINGVGIGQSMQKHLYLPEAHTDMIFAIGAEEGGLWFSIAVIVLFLVLFGLSVYVAIKAEDAFGRLLVIGMSFILVFPAFFNIGVVCEALPMKGMALPFFSYGGTNLVSAAFAVGTILSVGIHANSRSRKRVVSHG